MFNFEVRDLESAHSGILPRDLSLPPTPLSLRHLSRTHSHSMPRAHTHSTSVSRTHSVTSQLSVQSLYIPRKGGRMARGSSTAWGGDTIRVSSHRSQSQRWGGDSNTIRNGTQSSQWTDRKGSTDSRATFTYVGE
uniref:Uncharacterized protein n=1 Tax=Cacopsylla melanoneura TaxID=428564 RepID=A0A8D8VMD6_9HEMI